MPERVERKVGRFECECPCGCRWVSLRPDPQHDECPDCTSDNFTIRYEDDDA